MKDTATLVATASGTFTDSLPHPTNKDERDALMRQYAVATESAMFFKEQRKVLLDRMIREFGVESEVVDYVNAAITNNEGNETLLVSGLVYNLYLKTSKPPKDIQKDMIPQMLSSMFDVAPADVARFMKSITRKGTPRKTFSVLPR